MSAGSGTVVPMDQMAYDAADVLTLTGVVSVCADCGDERVFVATEDTDTFCCTTCDAAVFFLAMAPARAVARPRVADASALTTSAG